MKIKIALLTLFFSFSSQAKQIAITFDDAPMPSSGLFSGEERTKKIIESLKESGVSDALFFITTKHITKASEGRLKTYTDAGFHLANHSHDHISANKNDLTTFIKDFEQANKILKNKKNFLPFYRFPYLHHGNTAKKRDQIRAHLKASDYQQGYVTVDNYEWYLNSKLQQALREGKKVDYEALKQVYLTTLIDGIEFYDNIAIKTLERSPKHVLLLHENDISALFVGDLIANLQKKGWEIISPQKAYTDPIASELPDVLFNGQGRVAAIANAQGIAAKTMIGEWESTDKLDALLDKKKVFK